jgi:hypothetical protein
MSPLVIAAITGILDLIETVLLPNLNSSGIAAKIITLLEQVVPVILQGAKSLVPIVKNIIASLRGSGVVTADDLDRLDAQEALLDADFDAAADSATAEDAKG